MLPYTSAMLGLFAVIGGAVSFAGWAADLPALTDWNGEGISTQPNTSVAVMAAGLAVVLLAARRRRLAGLVGLGVLAIGGSTLYEYISGVDLGIDTLLMYGRTWGREGVLFPGRMGPPGAASWTLLGLSLILAGFSAPGPRRLAPRVALVAGAIASLSLIGYLYGATALYTVPTATVIALQTAMFILSVSLGIVIAIPEHGPMSIVVEDSPAGVLVRRILPALVVVPIVLGLVRLAGERAGYYDLAFGTAARSVCEIALLLGLLWWTASAVNRQTQEQRRAEARVVDHAQRVTDILESITDGFVTFDRDWRYTYVNAEAERLMLRTREDLAGRTAREVFPELADSAAARTLRRAGERRESVEFEDFNPALGRWFANKAYPTADGGMTLYFHDITDRKREQEALQDSRRHLETDLRDSQLLQRISGEIIHEDDVQALYEKIVDSAVLLMRSEFASLQALGTAGDHAGQLQLLAYRGFVPEAAGFWQWVTVGSASTCGMALRSRQRVVVPDVRESPLLAGTDDLEFYNLTGIRAVQSTPLISRRGELLGMISSHWREPYEASERDLRMFDILARQAADLMERIRAEESLRTADRRKNEFIAMLAHELRNPLAPVMNAIELMKREAPHDPTLGKACEIIDRQLVLMARLLDDLLDVGRITSDRLDLRRTRVDLETVIRGAAEMSIPHMNGYHHELTLSFPSVPVFLEADPARLGQIFGNLLNNASRYTDPNGRIAVAAERQGGQAVVTVKDNGIGIPADKLSSIFEMFAQVERTGGGPQGGLGIGLHLVKRLAEMHGGSIEARSEGPGLGSEFVVRLPALPEESAAVTRALVARAAEPAPAASRRILIVDDNVDSAESLATILQLDGNETHMAHDGLEAVEAAARLRPDVVLMDIGLPSLSGFDVCRRIRTEPWGRDAVLIAVTGWGQDDDRRRSLEAGFDYHLVKPVDLRMLSSLMHRG
jgi:PAS domain S-box-containing protein